MLQKEGKGHLQGSSGLPLGVWQGIISMVVGNLAIAMLSYFILNAIAIDF